MPLLGSAYLLLVVVAFILTIVHGVSARIPLWIPVLLITIAMLITAAR